MQVAAWLFGEVLGGVPLVQGSGDGQDGAAVAGTSTGKVALSPSPAGTGTQSLQSWDLFPVPFPCLQGAVCPFSCSSIKPSLCLSAGS